MKKFLKFAIAAAALSADSAQAFTVLSEDFNDSAFAGSLLVANDTSDRFGATDYYFANQVRGFTFGGERTFYARASGGSDGALLLNEPTGTASITLSGLVAGKSYTVSALLSGDNRPGSPYGFRVAANGNNIISADGVDLPSGTNPGQTVSGAFVATSSTATLDFSQTATSEASPIFDNLLVTGVPEPMQWSLMIGGFGLAGVAARRRGITPKRVVA